MNITKQLYPAIAITIVLTVITGIVYPLVITGLANVIFPAQAHGSLIEKNGQVIGSSLIGQTFTGAAYFHSRPSAAGSGYDPTSSGGTYLGPTSKKLLEDGIKTAATAAQPDSPGTPVPIDLVTSSGSGLDPHITPAAADFQAARVARERGITVDEMRRLIAAHTEGRQFGILGEPRVNVLELNLALDAAHPVNKAATQ